MYEDNPALPKDVNDYWRKYEGLWLEGDYVHLSGITYFPPPEVMDPNPPTKEKQ